MGYAIYVNTYENGPVDIFRYFFGKKIVMWALIKVLSKISVIIIFRYFLIITFLVLRKRVVLAK